MLPIHSWYSPILGNLSALTTISSEANTANTRKSVTLIFHQGVLAISSLLRRNISYGRKEWMQMSGSQFPSVTPSTRRPEMMNFKCKCQHHLHPLQCTDGPRFPSLSLVERGHIFHPPLAGPFVSYGNPGWNRKRKVTFRLAGR